VVWRVITTCADSTLGMSTLCLNGWTCADTYSFFYKHELLQKYDWYWRVEPEIKYFCDIT
jgi:hypothetical protein